MDFTVLADQLEDIKESEKIDKFLNIARELSNLWNVRVIIQTTALLRSARILRRFQEIWGDFAATHTHVNDPADTGVKKSNGVIW